MIDYISKEQAKKEGLKCYFTGKPCKNDHVAQRYTNTGKCVLCVSNENKRSTEKGVSRRYYESHKEQRKQYARENIEKVKKHSREWNRRNKKHMDEYRQQYYSDPYNKQHFLNKCKEYRKLNKGKYAAHCRNRQAQQIQATPCWLTDSDQLYIEQLYDQAFMLTQQTGIKHVVDHYYPLQGNNVSGLHCPSNLRVITEHENATKSNKVPNEDA